MTGRSATRWLLVIMLATMEAQASASGLLELYRLAEQRNPQIAAAREQRKAQEAQVPLARSQLYPRISASGNTSYVWEDTDLEDPPPADGMEFGSFGGKRDYRTSRLGVDLVQPVFRREAFIALEQARVVEDQAELTLELARQQMGLELAEAYFAALEARDAVNSYQAEREAVEAELKRSRRRYELGVGTIIEVNDALARFSSTRAGILGAQNQLRLALESLKRITNSPVRPPARAQVKFPLRMPENNSLNNWIEHAHQNNLNVQVTALSLEIAEAGVDAAQAQRYPRIDLVGSLQRDYQGSNQMLSGTGIETDAAIVRLELSLPLYTGGAISSEVRQRQAERSASYYELLDSRLAAALEVETAFLSLQNSVAQSEALREALQAIKLAEESTRKAVQLGQRTNIDLLNTQRERYQIQRDLDASRYQYLLAYLRLYIAAGLPVESAIEVMSKAMGNGDTRILSCFPECDPH